MHDFWSLNVNNGWIMLVLIGVIHLNVCLTSSLNHEGIALLKFRENVVNDPYEALKSWEEKNGESCPCSWFGIQCYNGHVISLNLENLCLEGTLSSELQHLLHLKSIILRNNSFSGTIPKELGVLKELKLLNLGYNDFRKPSLHELLYYFPALLLDSNGKSCHISSELEKLTVFPNNIRLDGPKKEAKSRKLLDEPANDGALLSPPTQVARGGHNNPSFEMPPPSPPNTGGPSPPQDSISNSPPGPPLEKPAPPTASASKGSSSKKTSTIVIAVGALGGFILLSLAVLGFWFWCGKKEIEPLMSPRRLTGQLQRAFVSGVKNLRRHELEKACEDFCNVIGTCSIGTIYKGTLSNGVEISVISLAVSSAKDWSKSLGTEFRKKIETLSKVNHKNFINLIGYCEEQEPFTRMLVFEYAPNGSLFEHLHVREAEHLDWNMRMRVAMGMAYCLEYMHHLTPPFCHPNLNSASIHLSDDYACKISDFCFWNEIAAYQAKPINLANLTPTQSSPRTDVYNYGLVLLEMMTGRTPHTTIDDAMILTGETRLQELIDPMLRRYKPDQLEKISELIKNCIDVDPQMRPTMSDVCTSMREITGIDRNKAGPRLSPLWWDELEGRGSVNGGEAM